MVKLADYGIVLSVKNVFKCFEMYEKPEHRLYQTLCAREESFYNGFWALKDINKTVSPFPIYALTRPNCRTTFGLWEACDGKQLV